MKSAYELAMERMQKEAPSCPLDPSQLEQIREIDSLYKSKIAEREVFLTSRLAAARASGDGVAIEELQRELARDISLLREEWESKKERVRSRS